MANYSQLKAAIADVIKTNGTKAITGQVLQDTLNSIVSVIGANYTFAGIATPSTNPSTPDQNVFYIATQGGTYTNFGATALPEGISLLMWNGSWTAETIMYNDGGVFDISVYKSTGGTLATFADLAAALDGGNNIPVNARKGGMSVKFVCSSDNKYVQYRLMSDSFNTTIANWQGVDNEPTVGSENLVESGGVYPIKKELTDFLTENTHLEMIDVSVIWMEKWLNNLETGTHKVVLTDWEGSPVITDKYYTAKIDVEEGEVYHIKCSATSGRPFYVIADENDIAIDGGVEYSSSGHTVFEDNVTVLSGAKSLYVGNYVIDVPNPIIQKRLPVVNGIEELQDDDAFLKSSLLSVTTAKKETLLSITWNDAYTIEPTPPNYPISQSTLNNFKVSDAINVNEGTILHIHCYMQYGRGLYKFTDNSDNTIECKLHDGLSGDALFNGIVRVPKGATKLYVGAKLDDCSRSEGHYVQQAFVATVSSLEAGDELTGKTWAVIGDSLSDANGRGVRTDKFYFDYISDKTGLRIVNLGASGTGYKNGDTVNAAFYQRINNIPTERTVDVATIFGSGNDCLKGFTLGNIDDTGTDTLCGCINTTLDNFYTVLPSTPIGIITPTPWKYGNLNPVAGTSGTTEMNAYVDAIIAICKRRSIPCLDLYHSCGLRPWDASVQSIYYSNDEGNNVHPNDLGNKIISYQINEFLKKIIMN